MGSINNDFDKNVFSSNLKRLMNKNNLKNKDLATLLGLSKSAISNYIAGISVPRTEVLSKIAQAFDVPIETLIKKPPEPVNQNFREDKFDVYQVPLFSDKLVSADIIYRNDNFNGSLTFPFPVYGDMDCYAVYISDELLAQSGITKKSIVIFASCLETNNGELAAVLLKRNMKIAVRRVFWETNKITLATDQTSESFKYKSKDDEIVVLGKVVFATFSPNA